jgi:hypothetical protein
MSAEVATPQLDQMLAALVPAAEPAPAVEEAPVETPAEEAPVEAPAQEEEKKTETPTLSSEEKNAFERARTALRRDGVPVNVIDSLDRDKLLRWGSGRAKAQSDADDAYRQLGELRKERETWAAKATEPTKESADSEPAEQPLDLDSLGKTLSDELGSQEVAGRVTSVLKSLESRAAAKASALESRLKEQVEINQRLSASVLRIEMDGARQRLGERFPELRDEKDFAKVTEKMMKLAPSGAYDNVSDLMYEASVLTFGAAAVDASKDQSKSRDRRNGLPTKPQGSTPRASKGKEERAMDFLAELEKKHGLA